jgi:hypothetical protein
MARDEAFVVNVDDAPASRRPGRATELAPEPARPRAEPLAAPVTA